MMEFVFHRVANNVGKEKYCFPAFYPVPTMFYSLQNKKSLDWSKLKAFAEDKINETKIEIRFGKGKKHCGKRRKCWLPAFSTFPTMFLNGFYFRVVKSLDCVVKG